MENILSPEEWILENHPDPDNIFVTFRDIFCNSKIAVKEDVCYSLMKQYSYYVKQFKDGKGEEMKCRLCGSMKYYGIYCPKCEVILTSKQ